MILAMQDIICNSVWKKEKEWKTGTKLPLSRQGELSNCLNWRGIRILSIQCKVLCIIILKVENSPKTTNKQSSLRMKNVTTDDIYGMNKVVFTAVTHPQMPYLHCIPSSKRPRNTISHSTYSSSTFRPLNGI